MRQSELLLVCQYEPVALSLYLLLMKPLLRHSPPVILLGQGAGTKQQYQHFLQEMRAMMIPAAAGTQESYTFHLMVVSALFVIQLWEKLFLISPSSIFPYYT